MDDRQTVDIASRVRDDYKLREPVNPRFHACYLPRRDAQRVDGLNCLPIPRALN